MGSVLAHHQPPTHVPVLLDRLLELVQPKPDDPVVDATIGGGGHAVAMLARTAPNGRLLGIDLDPLARDLAANNLRSFGSRVELVAGGFDHLTERLSATSFPRPAIIIADLGLSSLELADRTRGFSFQHPDAPLDMRFDPTTGRTAADLLAGESVDHLETIIRSLGEERNARTIARSIDHTRRRQPLQRVGDLVQAILAGTRGRRGKRHPATKTFQAIRMAVNDELGRLERFLPQAVTALRPGGRLAVISFHSLEDRLVKHYFRAQAKAGVVDLLLAHPATPSFAEVTTNPRSRSAKLRVVVRI